jgi:hydroxymethylpyrimidine/phosphomethylpyrimidine kinase
VNLNQVTLPCSDYDATVRFYLALGLTQIVDSPPRYARFETSGGSTFSIHASKSFEPCDDPAIDFEVDNVDLKVRELKNRGLRFEADPQDQDWLWREAYLRDPSGNRLCIYHAGEIRRNPPWKI